MTRQDNKRGDKITIQKEREKWSWAEKRTQQNNNSAREHKTRNDKLDKTTRGKTRQNKTKKDPPPKKK